LLRSKTLCKLSPPLYGEWLYGSSKRTWFGGYAGSGKHLLDTQATVGLLMEGDRLHQQLNGGMFGQR
jgi:hypothetical protein